MTLDYELLFVQEPDGSYTPVFRPMIAVRIIGKRPPIPRSNAAWIRVQMM
jgi:hypothetical protein